MCRLPRILVCTVVILIAAVAHLSSAHDVVIHVKYDLDGNGHPKNIRVGSGQSKVEIKLWDHHVGRLGKTDVQWTLHHPNPPAANTVWTLEWKKTQKDFAICPDLIRFSEGDTVECEAQADGWSHIDWNYSIVATSTNSAYPTEIYDPAIVFRTGFFRVLELLLVGLVGLGGLGGLYFVYRLIFRKKIAA